MKDLVDALQRGWIRGAALDIHENEPRGLESPLAKRNNVYPTLKARSLFPRVFYAI